MIAVAILLVIGGSAVLWLVSLVVPKGTIIGVGAVLWISGNAVIQTDGSRLLGSSLMLLGTIGFLTGLVEVIRENKRCAKKRRGRRGHARSERGERSPRRRGPRR